MAKLENSSDEFKHETVNRNLSQAIQQARLARKLTQKQLATAINEKAQVIQQYESGQAIPNPQVLLKLDRALGVHLPRK
jgi:putative transcription factor